MTISVEVRELAAKTAEEIRRRGWIQGGYANAYMFLDVDEELQPDTYDKCSVCAVGGVLAAQGKLVGEDASVLDRHGHGLVAEVAAIVATDPVDDAIETVTKWNDSRGRTAAEVLAVFDAIAADDTEAVAA